MNVSGSQARLAFKKESLYNEYNMDSAAYLLHFTSESLKLTLNSKSDTAIMGEEFDADSIPTGAQTSGGINFTAHPEGLANLAYFLCGNVKAVVKTPNGILAICYIGSQASCVLSKVGSTLNSKTGALGAEANDVGFGTSGSLDLSLAANDTLGKLLTIINGYANYKAYLIGGSSTAASNLIPDFTAYQLKNQTYFLKSVPITATTREHTLTPNGISGSMPSFSVCVDKGVESHGYSGLKVQDISLDIKPNDIVSGSVNVIGSGTEDSSVSFPIGLTKEQARTFVGFDVKAYINGVEAPGVSSAKFTLKRSLKDAPQIGTLYTGEPVVGGKGEVSIDLDFYWNENSKDFRAIYKNNADIELVLVGVSGDSVEANKPYYFIIRCPRVKITEAPVNIGGPDVVHLPVKMKAVVPNYNNSSTVEITCASQIVDYTV